MATRPLVCVAREAAAPHGLPCHLQELCPTASVLSRHDQRKGGAAGLGGLERQRKARGR